MNSVAELNAEETIAPAHRVEREAVERLTTGRAQIVAELGKVIVGQQEVIEEILIALLAGGHCLITGAPGLAKTLLVKSIAQIFHLKFQRIQFTPDLMPADITGTEILQETGEGRKMLFVRGPVFAQIILADEINRTPPKTQAALLEAMQEHQVTAAGVRHTLQEPFFVLAISLMNGPVGGPAREPARFSSWVEKLARFSKAALMLPLMISGLSRIRRCATAFF